MRKFIDEFKNEWEIYEDGNYKLIKEVEFAEYCLPTPEYIEYIDKKNNVIQTSEITMEARIKALEEVMLASLGGGIDVL